MEVLNVIMAALAAFAFGGVWYTSMSGLTTIGGGIMGGAGIGAFLITPWVAMNYAFGMRKPMLTVIDGVNGNVGCTVMGAVLNGFQVEAGQS